MADNSRKRHLAKTITWRIVGSVDTFILSLLITGNPLAGLKVSLAEVVTKMVLYYLHERVWFTLKIDTSGNGSNSKRRHIAKAVSWRIIGTMDTMALAWIITGNPMVGLKIGMAEVITKIFLYYIHERVWYKMNYGLSERKNKKTIKNSGNDE